MANTITTQTIEDGQLRAVIKKHIVFDGTGDESATSLVDVSALSPAPSEVVIERIETGFSGFQMQLHWDATTDVDIINLPEGQNIFDFRHHGGLINTRASGYTGDILFSTTGSAANDEGTIIIEVRKKGI